MIDAIIFSVQKRALIKVLENIQAGVLNLTLPDGSKHRSRVPMPGLKLIFRSPHVAA